MAVDKLQEEKGMALADFLREFHEAPFELIRGKRIPIMTSLAGHTMMIHAILDILKAYVIAHEHGTVLSEATFVEEYSKNWVKGSFTPDVLFFSAERFKQYISANPDWEEKPFVLVPDITIEVVSKNDSYTDINEKVDVYLELGVKEIWIIDPHAKSAFVHSAEKIQRLSKNESIRGSVLPDFELKLSELFGEQEKK
jgi:Uma2 family endonuclease